MDELISRAAAIDAIVGATAFPDEDYIKSLCQNPANSEDWLGGVCDAINAVEEVNAVDATPVVHGKWQWLSSTYDRTPCEMRYWCSECHHETITHSVPPWEKYCPNCGAKMDKDGE